MIERQGKKSEATEMRHFIYIQTVGTTTDGEGGEIENWSDSGSGCFAAIFLIRAQQVFVFRSVNVDATHFIKIRGEITVSELNRIRFGTRYFEILTVENIQERGIVTWITTKEMR
jgi:SPP1 family predicted phage head-tail adaptor